MIQNNTVLNSSAQNIAATDNLSNNIFDYGSYQTDAFNRSAKKSAARGGPCIGSSENKIKSPGGLEEIKHRSPEYRELLTKNLIQLLGGVVSELMDGISQLIFNRSQQPQSSPIPSTPQPPITSQPSAPETPATETPATEMPTQNEYGQPRTPNVNTPPEVMSLTPAETKKSLSEYLKKNLEPNKNGEVHEEQLQHGIVSYLLSQKEPKVFSTYDKKVKEYFSKHQTRASYEDAVKAGLKAVEAEKILSKVEVDKIATMSFKAAQLDKNTSALYDAIGGPKDETVAVAKVDAAAQKAEAALAKLAGTTTSTGNATAETREAGTGIKEAGHGFLWKPRSEADDKLVILLPTNISKNVASVKLYSGTPPTEKNLIEEGNFSGVANGDRAHFRFKRRGDSYPKGVVVVAKLKDGRTVTETIDQPSRRLEK